MPGLASDFQNDATDFAQATKAPPADAVPIETTVSRLTLGPFAQPGDEVGGLLTKMRESGLPVNQYYSPEFAGQWARRGAVAGGKLLADNGFVDLDGPGVAEAKRRVVNAYVAQEVFRGQALNDPERREMASSYLARAVKERKDQNLSEDEAAALHIVSRWDPAHADQAYQVAFHNFTDRPPLNRFESAVRSSGTETHLDAVVGLLEKTAGRGDQLPMSANHISNMQVHDVLTLALGKGYEARFVGAMDQDKIAYIKSQLGQYSDGAPGTGWGDSALDLLPRQNLQTLLNAKTASLTQQPGILSDPKIRDYLATAPKNYATEAVKWHIQNVINANTLGVQRAKEDIQKNIYAQAASLLFATGVEQLPEAGPTAQAQAAGDASFLGLGAVARHFVGAMEAAGNLGTFGLAQLRDQITSAPLFKKLTASGSLPDELLGMARDALTDQHLSNSMLNQIQSDPNLFGPYSKDVYKAVTSPADYFNKSHGRMLELQSKYQADLADPKAAPAAKAEALVGASTIGLYQGFVQPFSMLADDPASAGGLALQGLVGGLFGKGVGTVVNRSARLLNRGLLGDGLTNRLTQLASLAPSQAGMMREGFVAALDQAKREGGGPAVEAALNRAIAVTDGAIDSWQRTGKIKDSNAWVAATHDAVPLAEEHLGRLGGALLERQNIMDGLRSLPVRLGWDKPVRLDRQVALTLSSWPEEARVRALKSMYNADGANRAFSDNMQRWMGENPGKVPSQDQLVDMMPEVHRNLAGLLSEVGEANPRAPWYQQVAGHAFGAKAAVLPQLPDTLRVMAAQAVDNGAALSDWGTVRARGRVLLGVAERAVQGRLDAYDMLKRTKMVSDDLFAPQEAEDRAALLQINGAQKNLETHDFHQPYSLPDLPALWNEIDAHTMGHILDAHGPLFGGLTKEAVFNYKKMPVPREPRLAAASEATAKVRDLEGRLDALDRAPLASDQEYQYLRNLRGQLGRLRSKLQAGNSPSDKETSFLAQLTTTSRATEPLDVLDEHISTVADRLQARGRGLLDGTLKSKEKEALEYELRTAREDARAAWKHANTDQFDLVPEASGVKNFRELFSHEGAHDQSTLQGMKDSMLRSKALLADLQSGGLEIGGNGAAMSSLPIEMVPQAIKHIFRQGELAQANVGYLRNDMAKLYARMSSEDRVDLGLAMRTGVFPEKLAAKYPQLLKGSQTDQLSALWHNEQLLRGEYFRQLEEAGLPAEEVAAQRERSYDATYYAAKERPGMVGRGTPGGQTIQAVGGTRAVGGGLVGEMGLDELRFKSDPVKYRVRVGEPGGIVDETFDREDQARAFMTERYGPSAFDGATKNKGVTHGKTVFGDSFSLAEPLGDDFLDVNQPIKGWSPENRLERIADGLRDNVRRNVFHALRLLGGQVLDEDQFRQTQLDYGNDVTKHYVKVPDTPGWGELAGMRIHRNIANELVRGERYWKMMEAWRQGLRDSGTPVPDMIAAKGISGAGKVVDTVNAVARTALITLSPRTWFMRFAVNGLLFDQLIGGDHYLSAANAENRAWAFRAWKDPEARLNDPLYQRGQALGLFRGLDEESSAHIREADLNMLGVDPKTVAKNIADRKEKLRAYGDAVGAGDLHRAHVLQKDLAALEEAQDQMHADASHSVVRSIGKFFNVVDKGVAPETWGGAVARKARTLYNFLDQHFRAVKWKNLVDGGLSPEDAMDRIKTYTPNYADIPDWLRLQNPWIRPLVVSFPYELARITTRALTEQPAKMVGLLSLVPAWNLMQLARGGIDWDQWDRISRSRGPHNAFDQAVDFMSSIYMSDEKGRVTNSVDLGHVFAVKSLLGGHGALAEAWDSWSPPEQRSALGGLLASGVHFASNFIGNSVPLNILSGFVSGRDPMTGRLLVPADEPIAGRARALGRLVASTMLPPLIGRDAFNFVDAYDAPTNPKTGKPEYLRALPSAIIRGLTGVGIKGTLGGQGVLVDDQSKMASIMWDVDRALAPNDPTAQPINSPGRLQRTTARLAVSAAKSPEERAAAEAALDGMLREQAKVDIDGVSAVKGKTEREAARQKQLFMDEGLENVFNRKGIDRQAAVLVLADKSITDREMFRKFALDMQFNARGRVKNEHDPELVERAIGLLQEGAQRPGASPALAALADQLQPMLERARLNWSREQQKQAIINLRNAQIKKEVQQ